MDRIGQAKQLRAGDIHGDRQVADRATPGCAYQAPSVPSTKAPAAPVKGALIDGPYGGKKPVS